MTAEQFELMFMIAGGAVATLVGYDVIKLGDSPKVRRAQQLLRKVGPVLMGLTLILFIVSFMK